MAKNALQISDRLSAVSTADESLPFRQAPHNLEAEQALLGAILVNNEAMDRVSAFLDPQHFYDPLHQQIYETAAKLIHVGKQATPITHAHVLRDGRADLADAHRAAVPRHARRQARRPSSTPRTTAAPSTTSPRAAR